MEEWSLSGNDYFKWKRPSDNLCIGDVVVLKEDNLIPSQWPIAKIVKVNTGADELTRVVVLKTKDGTYTRPVTKVAVLLPCEK